LPKRGRFVRDNETITKSFRECTVFTCALHCKRDTKIFDHCTHIFAASCVWQH